MEGGRGASERGRGRGLQEVVDGARGSGGRAFWRAVAQGVGTGAGGD